MQQQREHHSIPDPFASVSYLMETNDDVDHSQSIADNDRNGGSTSTNMDIWKRKTQLFETITGQSREQIMKSTEQHRQQMRQGLQTLGAKLQLGSQELLGNDETRRRIKEQFQNVVNNNLSSFNIAKFTESITNQPRGTTVNDQLAMFNERMKEEALRRDIRREAEEACLQTMREHLVEFLEQNVNGTYEQWIFALHPENTQDVSLLHDMECKEVDLRFYIEESDHRRLWNETVKETDRQVVARSKMWDGNRWQDLGQPSVDLLEADNPWQPSKMIHEDSFSPVNRTGETLFKSCSAPDQADETFDFILTDREDTNVDN
jgi:hypothetical protein